MLDRAAMLAALDRCCARDRLFAMMHQLHDRSSWPAVLERKSSPLREADLAGSLISADELAAMVWRGPEGQEQVTGDQLPIKGG